MVEGPNENVTWEKMVIAVNEMKLGKTAGPA